LVCHHKARTYVEFQNGVLRRIVGSKREEEAGESGEMDNLYSSTNVSLIKSKSVRRVEL
jgi:hypothetical protein